jgi:transcriptional regulator GlxA family with amidase domain
MSASGHRAQELLATTERPIGHIAELVGFRDANYFRRVFRQRTGKSPRGFRIQQFQQGSAAQNTA